MNKTIQIEKTGSGPALVLLHGWGMNKAVFEPLITSLKNDFELYLVNLPGYGESNYVADFDQQIAQIAASLPPAALLGWSMGGLYASALASAFPQQFSALTLVACNPCFVQRSNWHCAVSTQIFQQFADDLQAGWGRTINRFLSLQMLGVDNARAKAREVAGLISAGGEPPVPVLHAGLSLLLNRDAREELAALNLPIKIILGERDALVPISLATEIAQLNSRIQVECLAGAAHAPFLSHPQEFIRAFQR